MTVSTPKILIDPGFLWIAPLATTAPSNTVAGSVFTDTLDSAWLPLGATTEGSEFRNASTVEAIRVAELFDPVMYVTTERESSIAFALADWTLSNYNRAMNGGVAALTATTGTGATALYTVEPPDPGDEVRCMLLWESTDSTVRLMARQCLQGGEVTTSFKKAPDNAAIPCTFNLEVPDGAKAWTLWSAGADRG